MKNVSHYAQTSRFQFRMTLFGQFFGDVGFTTEEDAGFIADLCKSTLIHGFELELHRSVDLSLAPDVFRSRCLAAGLNPDQPILFAESELVPSSFRAFVRANRAEWERNLLLRSKHSPRNAEDYARYSEDPSIKHWARTRDLWQSRLNRFNLAPRAWWGNLFLGCVNGTATIRRIIERQLSPSLHSKLDPTHHPELFAKIHTAYEDVLKAERSILALESALGHEEEKLRATLEQHAKEMPKGAPEESVT
jgi:hypothetical protein